MATDNGVRELPAIGLFRNGQFVQYEGDEDSERQILNWFTDEETLKIIGVIDEVNTFYPNDVGYCMYYIYWFEL